MEEKKGEIALSSLDFHQALNATVASGDNLESLSRGRSHQRENSLPGVEVVRDINANGGVSGFFIYSFFFSSFFFEGTTLSEPAFVSQTRSGISS